MGLFNEDNPQNVELDDDYHCYHPSGVDRDEHDCVHCECCCDCLGCEYGPRDGMLLGPVEIPEV